MNERDVLSYKLFEISYKDGESYIKMMDKVTDFILADRLRILEEIERPLKDTGKMVDMLNYPCICLRNAIDTALQAIEKMKGEADDTPRT